MSSLASRVRYDLMRELVVAVSSIVLFSLFGYIFQDFINVKLASFTDEIQRSFAIGFSYFVLILVALYLSRLYNNWLYEFESLENISKRLGEHTATIRTFRVLKYITSQIIGFGVCHTLIAIYIHQFSWIEIASSQLLLSGFTLLGLLIKRRSDNQPLYHQFSYRHEYSIRILTKWRLVQILFRHRLSQLCLILWLFSYLCLTVACIGDLPYATIVLLSIIGSLAIAGAITFQLQEDMNHIWLEQNLGISQDQFCMAYLLLGILLGGVLGVVAGCTYLVVADLTNQQSLIWGALKISLITSLGPIAVAPLMFQVDPSRPIIQFFISFFVCLFLGTGIFAHGGTALLIPVLIVYGMKYQKGNYYKS